jgi:hypothetical protein
VWLAALAAGALLSCQPPYRGGEPPSLGVVTEVPELGGPERCGPFSAASLVACVEPERLARDVLALARPRPPGSPHHAVVREACAARLAEHGYDVEQQDYGTGVNVVGVKRGFTKSPERLILSAHYDHLPECAGADDNASGVAVVLELARILAKARFDRTLVVACWDEGERRQRGSTAYAERAREREDDVIAALAFEAVGFSSGAPYSQTLPERFEERFPDQALALLENDERGDFLLLVADRATQDLAGAALRHGRTLGLPMHSLYVRSSFKQQLSESYRSDHTSFWEAGYPGLLWTDTGSYRNARIHCRDGRDGPSSLDLGFMAAVAKVAVGAVAERLELR